MSIRNVLMLFLAVGVAGLTAFYARSWIAGERASFENSTTTTEIVSPVAQVLVADKTLKPGTLVQKSDLKWQTWPEDGLDDGYTVKGQTKMDAFIGAVVRNEVTQGQPLTAERVVQAGDRGFLAAVLNPGSRAVSVPVNATSGISGFVFPGDQVDVLLTVKVRGNGSTARTRFYSRTLLANVRVLAMDQKVENKDGEASVAKTATLEVTPKLAEKVALALEMGSLSLSLRSLAKVDTSQGGSQAVSLDDIARAIASPTVTPKKTRNRSRFTSDSEIAPIPRGSGGGKKINVLRGDKADKTAL